MKRLLGGVAVTALCVPVVAQPVRDTAPSASDQAKVSISAGALYGTASLTGGTSIQPKWAPLLDLSYERGRFFASTERGVGYNVVQNNVWTLGAGLAYVPKRKASSDVRLRGMGDVEASPTLLLSADWNPLDDFIRVYGTLTSATKADNGSFVTVGTVLGFPIQRQLNGFVDVSAVAASRNYAQTYYGVTARQAATSGYTQFRPKAGLISTSASVGLQYEMTKECALGASLGMTRLEAMSQRVRSSSNAISSRQACSRHTSFRHVGGREVTMRWALA